MNLSPNWLHPLSGIEFSNRKRLAVLFFFVFPLMFFSETYCLGGGILHVFPPIIDGRSFPVARPSCLVSKTNVTVSESYIEVKTEQVFLNDNDFPLEALFIFPLNSQGPNHVSEVLVNGVNGSFELLNPTELFPLVKKITIQTEDPAPLAICGSTAIVCSGIRLNIRESKSFRITYRIPFQVRDEILDLIIPMAGERFALAPIPDYEVLVRFKMSRPVRTSLSPSHNVRIDNESVGRRLVTCRERDVRSPDDFRLVTTFSGSDLDLRVLFHRLPEKDGYFMAMIEPPVKKNADAPPFTDVVFLLDCSSSLGADNLALGKKTVILFLEKLRIGDRFEVIRFSSRQERLFGTLVEAHQNNISAAARFVETSNSAGGTDLFNAIMTGFDTLSGRKRPGAILMVTDGKATIGKTHPEALIEIVKRYNRSRSRIFILALGPSPDVATLDQIARITGGAMLQAPDSKDFEASVSKWLSNIISPQVTDLSINLKDMTPESVVPEPTPDIMGQESVIVLGRYSKAAGGKASVNLKGKISGKMTNIAKKIDLPKEQHAYGFIAPLWAMRKIASLMELERTRGQNQILGEQIKKLSDEFGFMNYDTSPRHEKFFVNLLWKYKTSFIPADVTQNGVKRVGDKLFKYMKGCWIDTSIKSSISEEQITFLSDKYFDMIQSDTELGPFLALGPEIMARHKGANLRVIRTPPERSQSSN